MRKDRQATMDKQFLDWRSYVTPDGREVLYGEDWDARVEDLRRRCEGRCEYMIPDLAEEEGTGDVCARQRCSAGAVDPDHIVKRSVKRDDRLANLQALCRFHHRLKHPEFETQFRAARQPEAESDLERDRR